MIKSARHSRLTHRDSRGASSVESAIVALVLFALVFGVVSATFVGRAFIASRYGAPSGARAGAIAGNDPQADSDVLRAVARAALADSEKSVTKVVVFKASGPKDKVPPPCLSGAVADKCNVYSNDDLKRPPSDFGSGGWSGDDSWSASERHVSRTQGTDYLGVYIETKTGVPSGPFPSELQETSVARLEAQSN